MQESAAKWPSYTWCPSTDLANIIHPQESGFVPQHLISALIDYYDARFSQLMGKAFVSSLPNTKRLSQCVHNRTVLHRLVRSLLANEEGVSPLKALASKLGLSDAALLYQLQQHDDYADVLKVDFDLGRRLLACDALNHSFRELSGLASFAMNWSYIMTYLACNGLYVADIAAKLEVDEEEIAALIFDQHDLPSGFEPRQPHFLLGIELLRLFVQAGDLHYVGIN